MTEPKPKQTTLPNAEAEKKAAPPLVEGERVMAPPPKATASTALAKPLPPLAGSFLEPQQVSTRLADVLRNKWHLVSPATSCPNLIQGGEVSIIEINLDQAVDTHPVGGGKFGLLKHALHKISAGAGVVWDPNQSGRLDDGSDPRYVHWRAVGAVRQLDGTVLSIIGDKEMDLREDSDQCRKIIESATTEQIGRTQLRDTRAHILSHAQSKAELRAIRKLGLRSSYTSAELQKPFIVVRLMFTGRVPGNAALERDFAHLIADKMLGGARAMFGPAEVPTMRAPVASMGPHAPPPVGRVVDDGDDIPASTQPSFASRSGAPVETDGAPQPRAAAAGAARAAGTVRFGKNAGLPIAELSDTDLEWYEGAIRKSIDDPEKAKHRASNEAHLREVLAVFERRNGAPPDEDNIPEGY